MDVTSLHIITLWCAILSKTIRGVDRLLPKGMTIISFRLLWTLDQSQALGNSVNELARMLVVRPKDVEAAFVNLCNGGLVLEEDLGGSVRYRITPDGNRCLERIASEIEGFIERSFAQLDNDAFDTIMTMVYDALAKPGNYYSKQMMPFVRGDAVPTFYYITAVDMMHRTLSLAIKRDYGLSFTDFRFLLELYPKRPYVSKLIRAKKFIHYLRVGRAYITTASYRLEEDGYLRRVPDPDDARGVSFQINEMGEKVVQEIGGNIYAAYVSLFGTSQDAQRRQLSALRQLLEGTDEELES